MANSRPTKPKPAKVTEFPPPESSETSTEATELTASAPPTPFDEPVPTNGQTVKQKVATAPDSNFFARVGAIKPADWGTRVYLYLYQIEPVCDLKQSGGKAYLMRYSEPVKDEHEIMLTQGSGKYRFVLAMNKITPQASNEMARYDFEIYNPQYPPKIPREVWVNDHRNKRWEALMPKPEPAPIAGTPGGMIDAIKLYKEIRNDAKEEMGPETAEPVDATRQTLETMRLAKDLFSAPTVATVPAKDPLEIATALFTIMNQTKADNPVIDMYRDELKALREEMKEERAEMRKTREAGPANAPKDLVAQLTDLAAISDKLEPLKKIFGFSGAPEAAVRAGRSSFLDVVERMASTPFGAAIGSGIVNLAVGFANRSTSAQPGAQPAMQPAPVVINAQQPNGTAPPAEEPEARISRIGNSIIQPMIFEFFLKDETGDTFAAHMWQMWPEDYLFIRGLGADNLLNRFRTSPQAWAVLQHKEPGFIEFINEFCKWDPNEDEGPSPGDDDGVVDLEAQS
jgi:hypothetical protein